MEEAPLRDSPPTATPHITSTENPFALTDEEINEVLRTLGYCDFPSNQTSVDEDLETLLNMDVEDFVV